MVHSQPKVTVIIATKNRTTLLKERSLKSVYNQSTLPHQVIVVDDSDAQRFIDDNISVIEEYQNKALRLQINHIINHRTKGAAGSWNSAVDYILSQKQIPENTFIAILDDDDEWHSNYIKMSFDNIRKHSLDMVACDFYRITEEGKEINTAPNRLDVNDFLVGNPGIQGSNIFIRLSCFLEAGCFDENIESCTDRDICIRITDLATIKYRRVAIPLMNHFAESTRVRMSTPNTEIKNSGLNNFWLKYSKRMTEEQKEGYLKRAKTLFNWVLPKILEEPKEIYSKPITSIEKFSLQVGVICSDYKVISPLLIQLGQLQSETFIDKIQIFLLENNLSVEDKKAIINQKQLLEVIFITKPMQDKWIGKADYFKNFSRNKNSMFSIAQARTLLQKYIGQVMKQTTDSVVAWILDEDMRITKDTVAGLKVLPQLKKQGVDIVIGKYEFSSPNPPINGVRTQLVDFWFNLNWLLNQKMTAKMSDISFENRILIKKYPDYYYDLSRKHSGHLEHPFWLKPNSNIETISNAIERLGKDIIKIFGGTPLTRSLLTIHSGSILDTAKDSVNRGGNTFIFNPEALDSVPNLNMEINGTDIRRSDMMWAIINKYYRKMNIKSVNIPIWHTGKVFRNPAMLNIDKVREEILGSCLYAGLTDWLKVNPEHSLCFSEKEISTIIDNMKHHLKQRLILLKQSFYRIRGVSKSIQGLRIYAQSQDLQKLTEIVDQLFSKHNFERIEKNVGIIPFPILSDFLNSMQKQSDSYKTSVIS